MKSAAYLKRVLESYKEAGLLPGDPDFEWNEAHHPTPRCESGTETVPLLKGHHFIHDLYQSEDWGRCCFYPGNVRRFIYGEGFLCTDWFNLVALYEKWVVEGGKKAGKKGGKRAAELGVGIHEPGVASKAASKGGRKSLELGVGIHAPGVALEAGRKGASKGGKRGIRVTNSQKWICLVTGHVSNPAGLTSWQKARGINTLLRFKLDGTDLVSQTMLLGLTVL